MKRQLFTVFAVLTCSGVALAGHTRPGYVDGCQSADRRYVVTAESKKQTDGKYGWEFTWKDNKTGTTHTGWLVGLPYGLEHFKVAYAHIFVPPGGETFAVFQTANWTGAGSKPPDGKEKEVNQNPSDEFKKYAGFADRIVIYKKTGEVVKRLSMNDILKPNEWVYVNWVQGNLYWLSEYPDVMKNGGEPPRCGFRYFRVSPDYSVLEFTVGPNSDAVHKVKDLGADVVNYRRPAYVSLTDGTFLDKKPSEKDRVPMRPFVGDLVKRGGDMKNYVPSLDPVRMPGKIVVPK